jgi:hypothetical protein
MKPLHSSLSCATLFQFLTPINFFASFSTASIHLVLGFPARLSVLVPISWHPVYWGFSHSMYLESSPYSLPNVVFHSVEVSEAWFQVSRHLYFFTVRGRQPLAQPPTWRARVSLLVWVISFDLSGMGGPTSSYATAGVALRVIWPRKPHVLTSAILFYSLQKHYLNKSCPFSQELYVISRPWSISSVAPTEEVYTSARLLLIVGNWNIRCWRGHWWRNIHTDFRENRPTGSKV